MDELGTPHDRYFRENFARVEVARDFLRHHLPGELLDAVDLDALEVSSDSHIAEDLRGSWSDLVYRVPWRAGATLEVYLLFEHKSHPDYWTPLQLLRYIVAAGERHRQQHPKARRLPPVYPLVLYHGRRRWRAALDFHGLIEPLPEVLAPFVPRFRYALHDISARTDGEIKGAVLTRLVLLALRHIWSAEPVERIRQLIDLIGQIEDQTEATRILHTLLVYYLSASPRLDDGQLRTLLTQTPMGETTMQTLAERFREQGRQQGWQAGLDEGRQAGLDEGRQAGLDEGRQAGLHEGRQAGQAAALLRLIERRFGPPEPWVQARVATADPDTLFLWFDRALVETRLEAVFGGPEH